MLPGGGTVSLSGCWPGVAQACGVKATNVITVIPTSRSALNPRWGYGSLTVSVSAFFAFAMQASFWAPVRRRSQVLADANAMLRQCGQVE
jgi:hypothetical protein